MLKEGENMRLNEMMNIGENLKQLRKNNNLTQEQFANKVGLPRTTYAHYESNKRTPDIETLNRIAKTFNTTSEKLIGNVWCYPETKRNPRSKEVSEGEVLKSTYNLLDYAGIDFELDTDEVQRIALMTKSFYQVLIKNIRDSVLIIEPSNIDFIPNRGDNNGNKES